LNYVTDMRHFADLDELSGDQFRSARRFAMFLGKIAGVGTANDAGSTIATALACQKRPGHKSCPGLLLVYRSELPPQINWACPVCDDQGMIYGWEEGAWDMSPPWVPRGDELKVELDLPRYRTLLSFSLIDQHLRRAVLALRLVDGRLSLRINEVEFEELMGELAAEVNHETNRQRRRRLEDLLMVLEATFAR